MTLGNIFDILQNLYIFQGVLVGRKLSPFINHVLSQKIATSTKLRLKNAYNINLSDSC